VTVLGEGILEDARRTYPYAKSGVSRWQTITEGAAWTMYEDVKKHFSGIDSVGKCVVFDIKQFRLIAIVDYQRELVIVRGFLKHADYDRDRWKNECGC
jgi:mRNA interferase HigB